MRVSGGLKRSGRTCNRSGSWKGRERKKMRHTFCSNRCECACMRIHTAATQLAVSVSQPVDTGSLYRRLRAFSPRQFRNCRLMEYVPHSHRRLRRRVGGSVSGRARLFSCQSIHDSTPLGKPGQLPHSPLTAWSPLSPLERSPTLYTAVPIYRWHRPTLIW